MAKKKKTVKSNRSGAKASKKKPASKSSSTKKGAESRKTAARKAGKSAVRKAAPPKKAAKKKGAAKKSGGKPSVSKVKVRKSAPAKPVLKAAPKTAAPAAPARKPDAKAAAAARAAAAMPSPGGAPRKQYIPDIERPTGMYGGIMLSDSPKPFPKTSPYSKSELKLLKESLVGEHSRLRRELASLEEMAMGGRDRAEDSTRFPSESSEYSAEMQAAETIMGVRTLEEERLAQVTEALERIDARRNYGLCLACGNKIGIERLIAKPHAHLCMDCRRRYERKRSQEGF